MTESITPKSFPDLMAGKKVLYVHGFLSAGSTHTATVLRQFMPQATVLAPDLPVHPEDAMQLLRDLVASEKPDLIIGTSMGGMYTEMLYGVDRICVNPAFEMGSTMTEHNMMGKQVFQNPRQDGVQELIVTKALVKEYREMTSHCFEQVDAEEQRRVFGLFGDADPVVHTFDLFHQHYPNSVRFHGEHRLLEKVIYHYLIPVVRWIDDSQEQRERPTVFIHWNTLMDGYGKPKSSLHKAYEFLLEHYNVYIVAPSLTSSPAFYEEARAWVEDVFSAPAWGHLLFANQLQLLYGDYLISADETDEFLGTAIRFGSDEFKTWEEIISFFGRLGGQ